MTLGLKGVGVMLLKPDPPILSLTSQCEPSYTVNWQNQNPTIDYFVIESSANGGGWATAYNGPNISLAQTMGLGYVVSYRGIACRNDECSDYGNIVTEVIKPGKPIITVQATDDDGDYYVFWDIPFGTDGFQLKENGVDIEASPFGSAHITGKTDGSYTYTIRGYNYADGIQCWSDWSDPKTCVVTIPVEPVETTYQVNCCSGMGTYCAPGSLGSNTWTISCQIPTTDTAVRASATVCLSRNAANCTAGDGGCDGATYDVCGGGPCVTIDNVTIAGQSGTSVQVKVDYTSYNQNAGAAKVCITAITCSA